MILKNEAHSSQGLNEQLETKHQAYNAEAKLLGRTHGLTDSPPFL